MAVSSNKNIVTKIEKAVNSLEYGSVEIYVQAGKVTQIATRSIVKTPQDSEKNN